MSSEPPPAREPWPQADEIERLRNMLKRCRTVLGLMAKENQGALFWRWAIHHEPLRGDAKNLLPEIDRILDRKSR